MLGWFKKKAGSQKKSRIDKLIMGAILGGAIGSVVGMSIAPKKGKESREYLVRKSQEVFKKGREISTKFAAEYHPDRNEIDTSTLNPVSCPKIFARFSDFKNNLFNRFKKRKNSNIHDNKFKKIPNEHVEENTTDIIKF